ncbi:hypothetical protein [Streptomyces sp. 891-h]|nr:hypothetical protein [Streptomyces sp. 891-h]UNZ16005.1 hypothetical protein HC362_01740 [Streptomyces sp. 891-h]
MARLLVAATEAGTEARTEARTDAAAVAETAPVARENDGAVAAVVLAR